MRELESFIDMLTFACLQMKGEGLFIDFSLILEFSHILNGRWRLIQSYGVHLSPRVFFKNIYSKYLDIYKDVSRD